MSKDTGGTAFPGGAIRKVRQRANDAGSEFVVSDIVEPKNEGMTLRDYFAGKAAATFLQGAVLPTKEDRYAGFKIVAIASYEFADAMIEARKQ